MISGCSFIRRKDGLSSPQFENHWLNVHGPLAAAQPGVARYIQNRLNRQSPATNDLARSLGIDGIAQIWFENEDDRTACYSSPQAKVCDEDSLLFIGATSRVRTQVVQHRAVWERPAAAKLIVLQLEEAGNAPFDAAGHLAEAAGVATLVEHHDIREGAKPKTNRPMLGLTVSALCEACFDDADFRDHAADTITQAFGRAGLALFACHEKKIV